MTTKNLPQKYFSLLGFDNKDAIDLTAWWLMDTILEIKKAVALGNLRGDSKQCNLLVEQLQKLLSYKLKKQTKKERLETKRFMMFIGIMKKESICPNSICSNVEEFYGRIRAEAEFKQEKKFLQEEWEEERKKGKEEIEIIENFLQKLQK